MTWELQKIASVRAGRALHDSTPARLIMRVRMRRRPRQLRLRDAEAGALGCRSTSVTRTDAWGLRAPESDARERQCVDRPCAETTAALHRKRRPRRGNGWTWPRSDSWAHSSESLWMTTWEPTPYG